MKEIAMSVLVEVSGVEQAFARHFQGSSWVEIKSNGTSLMATIYLPNIEGAQLVADAINKAVAK